MTEIQSFDNLYPGRFLKAGMFNGQPVTYTIKNIQHDALEGDEGIEQKVVLSFEETPFEHVLPKVNAVALKAMFGAQVQEWIGRRVTFYGTTAIMPFPKKKDEPCIRVFGSPDIGSDVRCEWKPPRRKAVVQVLRPVQSSVLIAALAAIEAAVGAVALERFLARANALLQEGKISDKEHAEITDTITKRLASTVPSASQQINDTPGSVTEGTGVEGAEGEVHSDVQTDGTTSTLNPVSNGVPEAFQGNPKHGLSIPESVSTATPIAADLPATPAPLKLRDKQQLIRIVNGLPKEKIDKLTAAIIAEFGFDNQTQMSIQLTHQGHADFIHAFIKGQ